MNRFFKTKSKESIDPATAKIGDGLQRNEKKSTKKKISKDEVMKKHQFPNQSTSLSPRQTRRSDQCVQHSLSLEQAEDDAGAGDLLRQNMKKLKATCKQISVDQLEDLRSELDDLTWNTHRIQEIIARPYGMSSVDDSELEAELEQLEAESELDALEAEIANAPRAPSLKPREVSQLHNVEETRHADKPPASNSVASEKAAYVVPLDEFDEVPRYFLK